MAVLEITTHTSVPPAGGVPPETRKPAPRNGGRLAKAAAVAILCLLAAFFAIPLFSGLWFSFWIPGKGLGLDALRDAFGSPAIMRSLGLSIVLSLASVVLLLVVLIPAVVLLHVSAQRFRPLIEVICTLPLVIPAIALVAGVMAVLRAGAKAGPGSIPRAISQALQDPSFPLVLIGCYAVVLLPYAFRILDNALGALPVKQLLDSARGLGASFPRAVLMVIVPNIRPALWYCAFFGISAGLAEFTFSVTLGFSTLSVELMALSGNNFRTSIAVSLLVTLLSWALMIIVLTASNKIASTRKASS